MHFVGLLAASFPSAIDYLVLPTLASFLLCVIVVGIGVYAAHAQQSPNLRIGLGAVAMGLGISTMHYVGMRAVHLAGPTYQEAPFVVASVLVSIAASAFALLALGSRPNRQRLFLGAVGLGWRSPACTTPPWPACASIPCASTSAASSRRSRRFRAMRSRCSRP
jgi:NO-binding membrane sensor protein with MHYT domain